ncbi:hypothetical protein JXA12_02555 [Candidatus Woesearchaeota archaeon]|nr:hypothetical protein [Candidatus Woesearchaeota archaeon]
MSGRKAQLQQMFIYIMAIIVIGFLVLVGYRAIDDLLQRKCNVEMQQFVLAVDRSLDHSSGYGTVKKAVINAPCSYARVCFVDTIYVKEGKQILSQHETHYPIISLNTKDKIAYNIYLIEPTGSANLTFPLTYDDRIRTDEGEVTGDELLCIDQAGGSFSFWLEGRGKEGIYLHEVE